MRKICLSVFVLFLCAEFVSAQAVQLSDATEISLLTCAPASEVYSLYGHTAIRINDPVNRIDMVFNYGMFDFSAPNFIYRFARGETDYCLGIEMYADFLAAYRRRKSGVTEQVLNLTGNEKQSLANALVLNARPENSKYRYNFFYDNCSTRPRILIEKNVEGLVEYPEILPKTTFRTIVHHCNRNHRWLTFGIDLGLGSPLDDTIKQEVQMFLPANLMTVFAQAQVKQPDGQSRNLIAETRQLAPYHPVDEKTVDTNPVTVFRLLLALALAVFFIEFKLKKYFVWFDVCLFICYGLTGCMLVFLSFFSVHPTVFPNPSLIWAHPLHLILAAALLIKPMQNFVKYYMNINKILLVILVIYWTVFSPDYNQAFFALALTLCLRSFFYGFKKKYEMKM